VRTFPQQCGIFPTDGPADLPELRDSGGFPALLSGTPVAPPIGMITKDGVEAVLGRIRPFLQADGGDIEVVHVEGNSVDVRLTGMCAGCPSAHMTLYLGVETALREELPEFESLRLV